MAGSAGHALRYHSKCRAELPEHICSRRRRQLGPVVGEELGDMFEVPFGKVAVGIGGASGEVRQVQGIMRAPPPGPWTATRHEISNQDSTT